MGGRDAGATESHFNLRTDEKRAKNHLDDADSSHLFTRKIRIERHSQLGETQIGKAACWPPFVKSDESPAPDRRNYRPATAPAACGYIDAIFSSSAFMVRPVSRVASTAG